MIAPAHDVPSVSIGRSSVPNSQRPTPTRHSAKPAVFIFDASPGTLS